MNNNKIIQKLRQKIKIKKEFGFLYMWLFVNLPGAGLITDAQKEMSMEWMNGWLCANEWISVDGTAQTPTSSRKWSN